LNQQFNVQAKNQVWASDITYVYTAEGRLYLAVVIDLYSRQIVGVVLMRLIRRCEQAAFGDSAQSKRNGACCFIRTEGPV
ncbi:DDE-type integrase/transposase/recombinase, partial [Aggregatibacter actinomycetemcomitans]|uniref:DDE-type integrase/transposase/recombinase n=1 Tax=Aggregatibacter actinomycetemcomitans TaxID=714 RepID=UPI0030CD3D23